MGTVANFVLDSFALIAFFEKERGAETVERLLDEAKKGQTQLYLSLINGGEIYYSIFKSRGEQRAEEALEFIDQLPIKILEVDRNLIYSAARIKSQYPLSYADCFAAALAKQYNCPVLTGDPEFKKLQSEIKISWL